MCVPLVYRDKVIGVLHFRSKKQNAYTEQDLRLAERIGVQIAGAIANAQLYADLKKTEQELKESEQRYRELSIIDDLTQLYNSRHFYFQLKIELDRSNRYEQPLTLLLLDLDNFKHSTTLTAMSRETRSCRDLVRWSKDACARRISPIVMAAKNSPSYCR